MPVTDRHPEYADHEDDWRMMEDALKGERAIKGAGIAYLPKTDGMRDAEAMAKQGYGLLSLTEVQQMYADYKDRATYPLWVKDSLRTMMGLVARQEPEVALPNAMKSLQTNATADGFDLKQLFLRVVSASLTKGRKPLLGDFDDEGKPYVSTYTAESAINWKIRNVDGRQDLTMVVLEEVEPDEEDEFSHRSKKLYRVLDLSDGGYRVRILNEDGSAAKDEIFPGRQGGSQSQALDFIPLVLTGSTDNAPSVDEIPLLTMAQAAIGYYRNSADYEQQLHKSTHPLLVIKGLPNHGGGDEDGVKYSGPSVALTVETDGDAKFIQPTADGTDSKLKAMEARRNAALEAGARVIDVSGAESGEARKARQNDQHTSLYSVVVTAAEAIEQVLKYLATWMGLNEDEVVFRVEPKFSKEEVDAALLQVVHQIVMSNGAPVEVLFESLRKAGLTELSDDELNALLTAGGLPAFTEGE